MAEIGKKAPLSIPPEISAQLVASYGQVLFVTFLATLVLMAAIAVPLLVLRGEMDILVYVILAGSLGAFFSSLTRLYAFRELPAVLLDSGWKLRSVHLAMYALVPPIVGAIGATVIYVMFSADLLRGPIFPLMGCEQKTCVGLSDYIYHYGPVSSPDYAKSLVWGFIAGFSERFVPDVLGRAISLAAGGKGLSTTSSSALSDSSKT